MILPVYVWDIDPCNFSLIATNQHATYCYHRYSQRNHIEDKQLTSIEWISSTQIPTK